MIVCTLSLLYLILSHLWLCSRKRKIALQKERMPKILLLSLGAAIILSLVSVPIQRIVMDTVYYAVPDGSSDKKMSCFLYYVASVFFFPMLTGPYIIRAWVLESHIKYSRKARNMALNELSEAQKRYLTTLRDRTSHQWGVFAFIVLLLGSGLYGFGLYLLDSGDSETEAPPGCVCVMGTYGVAGTAAFAFVSAFVILWYYKKLSGEEEDKFGLIVEMRNVAIAWTVLFGTWTFLSIADPGDKQAHGDINWGYFLVLSALVTHLMTVTMPIVDSYHGKLKRRICRRLCCSSDGDDGRGSFLVGDTLRRRFTSVAMPSSRSHKTPTRDVEMADVSASIDARNSFSLENVLSFPVGIARFEDFLTSEFCVENLQFWLGVKKFKTDHRTHGVKKVERIAKTLFANFIQTNATWQVNISDALRSEITHRIAEHAAATKHKTKLPVDIFDGAFHETYEIMLRDSFPRFKKSKAFDELYDMWKISKDNNKRMSNRLSVKVRNLLGA